MAVMQCTHRLPIQQDTQAIRPRATRRRPPQDETAAQGLVIVAHLASLASVGAFVIGLTLGSIAMSRCFASADAVPGLAETAPDDETGLHTNATETAAGTSR